MRWLADGVYCLAAILYLPIALYNAIFLKKNRTGWAERFGAIPTRPRQGPRIWIHAVSLGEINATPRLAQLIEAQWPGADVVFSTTTDTGFNRAVQIYGRDRVFRFPLDFSWVVSRALNQINPALIVLVELEVWPNLVCEAARRNIPVVVVNGRLTERSGRRLLRFGGLMRSVFGRLAWVGAQDESIAARFRQLGVPSDRLDVTGSVKWDTAVVAESVPGDSELARAIGLDRSRPTLVCGSTGPGEEAIILDAFARIRKAPADAPVQLIIIPRKPERFEEVAALIGQCGFKCIRRSRHPNGNSGTLLSHCDVVLGDTMGELRVFYSLAQLVFIGRSLIPMGGSDPMEAAGLGKPIVTGRFTDNFDQPVKALAASGALSIVDSGAELADKIQHWLGNLSDYQQKGVRGRETVLQNQGATSASVSRLLSVLMNSSRHSATFQRVHSGIGSP